MATTAIITIVRLRFILILLPVCNPIFGFIRSSRPESVGYFTAFFISMNGDFQPAGLPLCGFPHLTAAVHPFGTDVPAN
jgi:hypothetical protein